MMAQRQAMMNPMMAQQQAMMMQMMMMPTIVDEGMREKLRAAMIKQRMLEMLIKQGMDPKTAMEKVELMAKNLDDGDFDVEEAMGSPKKRLDNYLRTQWAQGKKKLQVQVDYGNVPLEWEYLNQYHGIQHPLAMTRFAQKYGLPGAPAPIQTFGAPMGMGMPMLMPGYPMPMPRPMMPMPYPPMAPRQPQPYPPMAPSQPQPYPPMAPSQPQPTSPAGSPAQSQLVEY